MLIGIKGKLLLFLKSLYCFQDRSKIIFAMVWMSIVLRSKTLKKLVKKPIVLNSSKISQCSPKDLTRLSEKEV